MNILFDNDYKNNWHPDLTFYQNKKVFITGHTGFKGAWLCRILINAGARLFGYALSPPTDPALFSLSGVEEEMVSFIGDIRDKNALMAAVKTAQPEIIIHMAAQPLVLDSYKDPSYTYEVNVLGTVNILECVRQIEGVHSFLNVTTDKVYQNNEWHWGYRENDRLGGYDPYSNSKSCSELITQSYIHSFFEKGNTAISTARAGNVIGGGDFSDNRIIPDCIRAAIKKEVILIRNPYSTRPYQHVLEPLFAYLLIAEKQYENYSCAGAYNVGPDDSDCVASGKLAGLFCASWGEEIVWENTSTCGPREANFLKLDCSKIKDVFGWRPRLGIEQAVAKTVEWTREYLRKGNIREIMIRQIEDYIANEKSTS